MSLPPFSVVRPFRLARLDRYDAPSQAMRVAMDEAEQLSELINNVYDAALDPELWVGVLERTCDYVGGLTASLVSHDIFQKTATLDGRKLMLAVGLRFPV